MSASRSVVKTTRSGYIGERYGNWTSIAEKQSGSPERDVEDPSSQLRGFFR